MTVQDDGMFRESLSLPPFPNMLPVLPHREIQPAHGGQEGFTVEATLVLNLEAYLSDFERLNVLLLRMCHIKSFPSK